MVVDFWCRCSSPPSASCEPASYRQLVLPDPSIWGMGGVRRLVVFPLSGRPWWRGVEGICRHVLRFGEVVVVLLLLLSLAGRGGEGGWEVERRQTGVWLVRWTVLAGEVVRARREVVKFGGFSVSALRDSSSFFSCWLW